MAMVGRSKSYQCVRRAVQCSSPFLSSCHYAFPAQDHLAGLGSQAQRALGGTHGFPFSQGDGDEHFASTESSILAFVTTHGGTSRFRGMHCNFLGQGRSNDFVVMINQVESSFPECGVRYYRGGGRGRGRVFHDFDREYGPPGQERGFDGRDDFDSKDEFGGGLPRDFSDFRKLGFEEEDVEKPETPEERLAYMKTREREIMLQKFQSLVIDVNRTFKVTKGGGEISFTALVVCGNGDGLAGWAKGKGPKASRAIREASSKALNNLHYFERFKGQSIYHYVEAKYEKTKVRLWPEWTLGKFRAAGIVRSILLLAGITSVKSKLIGSSNPHNTVKATFLALSKIKTPKEYEEQFWRAVVERHLILDDDGKPHPKYRKVSSYVL